MEDKRLNDLLRWSIENSQNGTAAPADGGVETAATTTTAATASNLTPDVMAALMGGPSEADLMRASMDIITADDVTLENKLIAFDNFEQLVESLDNANNMATLGLWTPLLAQLAADRAPELRAMAAWCVGTAVQNNEKTQERLLAAGGIPLLVAMATASSSSGEGAGEGDAGETTPPAVRGKAVYALSSAIRNYQPALDAAVAELVARGHPADKVDAADMEAVDTIIVPLRQKAKGGASA
ncbi:nucleotide exchange factor Fes1 [Cordyceps javanica]|uniref:Nucleotide exchange factor Fes1 n=1 Tax=Cordyceps javanica TaxID=43265 RepID=A0A545VQN9_9HYPO|nr:nucleotide exchange factor Fes1 [Cordyceps javanica]TQW04053.1 nucleotide exchange factor Fes1 [Cordyceps javanica]